MIEEEIDKPRSNDDINEAIQEIKNLFFDTSFLISKPKLAVLLPTILDALGELLDNRKLLDALRKVLK